MSLPPSPCQPTPHVSDTEAEPSAWPRHSDAEAARKLAQGEGGIGVVEPALVTGGSGRDISVVPGLIALVGGESTGKSTLARALTAALAAIEVREALRDWVESHGRVPSQGEQWDVMAAQVVHESEALNLASSTGAAWVVSDGGVIMTAVYSSLYYNDDSLLPEALRLSRRAALVVWCDDDIPWVADEGQRDGPDLRAAAQRIIGEVLRSWNLRWVMASGDLEARVAAVVGALGDLSESG